MWVIFAFLAAVFSGLSVIFQKQGMNGKPQQISAMSNTAGLAAMLLAVCMDGSIRERGGLSSQSWWLIIASGGVQALSWLTYFLALKDARVNVMMALDKVNIVAAMLLSHYILGEAITAWMIVGCTLILLGSAVMANIRSGIHGKPHDRQWMIWAVVSPCLQALANVLAKMDTSPTDPDLSAMLRTLVVVAVLWGCSFVCEGHPDCRRMLSGRAGINLLLGGAMVGISYIFMYRAIYDGINAVVTPIVKTNFLISTAAAFLFLHEKFSKRDAVGFLAVAIGVLLFLV